MSLTTSAPSESVAPPQDAAPVPVGWSFLRSRRWLGYSALLVAFSLACAWFGNWQFDRRDEAQAEIARIDLNYDAAPVPLGDALTDRAGFDEDRLKWRTVEVVGEYVGDPVLARNRPGNGSVGSDLIQALELPDGSVFFVDRGWIPVSGTDDAPETLPTPAAGEVTVLARLRASEPGIAGREASGSSVPSIDVPLLAGLTGVGDRAYLGAYGQLVAETPAGETGVLAVRPERDEGPHLSYALQWYVFILIAIIGVGYAARQEYRALNPESDSVRREDRRREARSRRRGPSDAEEEDALLDG
ncbi:SURF1 family protein [Leucobacter weissii]|uniref:SURF1-like protein n=1 Tax=Leucobacter weissii TaxID=1983706 RepID=A0A939MPZ6_9MICO|nr:SURF1 family protein [Leucobacter weissii]MBO1902587.1 SURF1 family protein [Leucobacter weissii]